MFRRLKLAFFVLMLAALARHAAAQSPRVRAQNLLRDLDRGYTDKELIAEKKLLNDKSRAITWEALPLIELQRIRSLSVSPPFEVNPEDEQTRQLKKRRMETALKRFIDEKLKDRTFTGAVRIGRIEPNGEKYTIYAKEPARPNSDLVVRHGFENLWPAYFCQCQSDSKRGFKVGENVDIIGKIEDLKEDGKTNTLFLKSVTIATEVAKEKTE
jgi:hypothetical protein